MATFCWSGPATPGASPSWARGTSRPQGRAAPDHMPFVAERRVAVLGSDGNSDAAPSLTDGVPIAVP
jgi:hypothetical protein